jgi:hypothetical protein
MTYVVTEPIMQQLPTRCPDRFKVTDRLTFVRIAEESD